MVIAMITQPIFLFIYLNLFILPVDFMLTILWVIGSCMIYSASLLTTGDRMAGQAKTLRR